MAFGERPPVGPAVGDTNRAYMLSYVGGGGAEPPLTRLTDIVSQK